MKVTDIPKVIIVGLVELCGLCVFGYGVWRIYRPLAYILTGIALILVAQRSKS